MMTLPVRSWAGPVGKRVWATRSTSGTNRAALLRQSVGSTECRSRHGSRGHVRSSMGRRRSPTSTASGMRRDHPWVSPVPGPDRHPGVRPGKPSRSRRIPKWDRRRWTSRNVLSRAGDAPQDWPGAPADRVGRRRTELRLPLPDMLRQEHAGGGGTKRRRPGTRRRCCFRHWRQFGVQARVIGMVVGPRVTRL